MSHEVGDQKLVITSLNDRIIIDDFIGFSEEIFILKESFLSVHYTVRSGSNQSREHLLLLCINNNKLYEALHAISLSTYDVVNVYDKKADSLKLFDEHGKYGLSTKLICIDKDHYKLSVNIQDESKSKRDPKTDHNYNKLTNLNFDMNRGVFYSTFKDISKYFTIYDPKARKEIRQYIMGRYPAIELGKNNYYYINNGWYEEGYDDHLFKYTYK
ncbi:hypothetical protein [Mucilaginibacter sp. NFX135]|uniref:hypothetical protein n=1 Tax=Mucilaginibacter sp. NFX135 TaxID=3402687 RepID=UPI003AFB11A9